MIINDRPFHFIGLSTDTKPLLGEFGEGSIFEETDTDLKYCFSVSQNTWLPLVPGCDVDLENHGPYGHCHHRFVCVVKIEKTYTDKNIDYYTIYYSNGATTIFTVRNGNEAVAIGENNNWILDGVDTGICAKGSDANARLLARALEEIEQLKEKVNYLSTFHPAEDQTDQNENTTESEDASEPTLFDFIDSNSLE